jgi:hypothetical protein
MRENRTLDTPDKLAGTSEGNELTLDSLQSLSQSRQHPWYIPTTMSSWPSNMLAMDQAVYSQDM